MLSVFSSFTVHCRHSRCHSLISSSCLPFCMPLNRPWQHTRSHPPQWPDPPQHMHSYTLPSYSFYSNICQHLLLSYCSRLSSIRGCSQNHGLREAMHAFRMGRCTAVKILGMSRSVWRGSIGEIGSGFVAVCESLSPVILCANSKTECLLFG